MKKQKIILITETQAKMLVNKIITRLKKDRKDSKI